MSKKRAAPRHETLRSDFDEAGPARVDDHVVPATVGTDNAVHDQKPNSRPSDQRPLPRFLR